jgi:hypothetical protein
MIVGHGISVAVARRIVSTVFVVVPLALLVFTGCGSASSSSSSGTEAGVDGTSGGGSQAGSEGGIESGSAVRNHDGGEGGAEEATTDAGCVASPVVGAACEPGIIACATSGPCGPTWTCSAASDTWEESGENCAFRPVGDADSDAG